MRAAALTLVLLTGCAQIAGIETTSSAPPPTDSRPVDATSPADATPPADARPCVGGDARIQDPGTGSCFVLFTTPMTREQARTTCLALGADVRLARIESAAENAVVTGLVGTTSAAIGGMDQVTEGAFVWQDGAPFTYTNWNAGEPNNGAGAFEEDCVLILGSGMPGIAAGVWDDRPCAPPPVELGSYPFVCEHG